MKWSKKDLDKLKRLYPDHSCKQIAVKLRRNPEAVKSKALVLGLKKAPGYVRNADRMLTSKEQAFLRDNYFKYPGPMLCKMMGRSKSTILHYRRKLGLPLGKENTGRYKKGAIPPNKGKKMPPGWGGATRFKKGHLPKNAKTDGHVSIRQNKGRKPSVWIRIHQSYWRELHRVVWEKTVGPIPHGYSVCFKDKNTLNCKPENLYIVNRHQHMMRNTIQRYDPELRSLIRLASKLKRKILSYEKQD